MDPAVYIGRPANLNYTYVKCIGRSAICTKIQPSDKLSEYIDYLWYINWSWPGDGTGVSRFVPTGRFELVFNLGDPVYESFSARNWVIRPEISLSGPKDRFTLINPSGKFMAVGVVFKAGKISVFMEDELSAATRGIFFPTALLNEDPSDSLENLKGESSMRQKLSLINRFMEDCLLEENYHPCFIDFATQKILDSKGKINVNEIADMINCSERHLHRKFKERVGMGPKTFAQIVKVNSIIEEMLNGNRKYSELAFDYGFFDQTHFNKTFKRFVGQSPKQFMNEFKGIPQCLQFSQNAMLRSA